MSDHDVGVSSWNDDDMAYASIIRIFSICLFQLMRRRSFLFVKAPA